MKFTGKTISKIIEQGKGHSTSKLQFVHENGTDTVFHKSDFNDRVRDIPIGHVVVGMYGIFGTYYIEGLGFITAKF